MLGTFYADADLDGFGGTLTAEACEAPFGFVEDDSDCDDLNAAAYPGAPEVCDDVDNNCDGTVDADDPAVDLSTARTFYADSDSDGYGDPSTGEQACSAPSDSVENADDCDDTDADLNPETLWYSDIDGDGFGFGDFSTASCEAPDGYSRDASDCNDYDATVSPAADEICDDIDNNCDGTVDEDSAIDAPSWYADVDGDGYGDDNSTAPSCLLPSGYSAIGGDCDDTEAASNPDATEICDGIDNDCDSVVDYDVSVPTDYATVQDAVDAVADGEGICVEAGTHYGSVYPYGKSVTIAGAGAGSTFLDADGDQFMGVWYGETVQVVGLTIQNSWYYYGGVLDMYDSEVSFTDVEITDSGCDDGYDCYGGLFYSYYGSLVLDGVDISDVSTDGRYQYGGLLYSDYGSEFSLTDVTVSSSSFRAGTGSGSYGRLRGGLIYAYYAEGTISGLEVTDSSFDANAYVYGGLLHAQDSEIIADGLVFDDNEVGTLDSDYGYSTVYGGFVYGGFVYAEESDVQLSNASFAGNTVGTGDWLDALFVAYDGDLTLTNTLIVDNEVLAAESYSDTFGTFYADYYSTVTLVNGDISGNNWDIYQVYSVLGYRGYQADFSVLNTNVVDNTMTGYAYAGLIYTDYPNDSGYGEFSFDYSNDYGNWTSWDYGYNWYDGGYDGDFTAFDGVLADDPLYTDAANGDYTLGTGSPAIDAGSPDLLDADGTTSDIGAFGGPSANL